MRLDVPEMIWHGDGTKERITSIDFHPFFCTFVTGGSESFDSFKESGIPIFIKEWEIIYKEALKEAHPDDKAEFLEASFNEADGNSNTFGPVRLHRYIRYIGGFEGGHNTTVNCIKFSPSGQFLASGADAAKKESGATIIIWSRREKFARFGSEEKEVGWGPYKTPLFGHVSDITDLKWSMDSKFLMSGSVDNAAILWNIDKMCMLQRFDGHTHFVQGVAIDPFFKYLITQGSDRCVKIWKSNKSKQKVSFYPFMNLKKLSFKTDNVENDSQMQIEIEKSQNFFRLFLDETAVSSFFRRPDWSPDGSFFLLPAAQYQIRKEDKPFSAVLLYRRNDFNSPCMVYSTNNKPAVCARFCSKLYKLDPTKPKIFDLSYKMLFAIATVDSVLVYQIHSLQPLFIVGNIHFASLTDLAWCAGKCLGISSSDGFCSFVFFEEKELGVELEENEVEDENLKKVLFRENYYEKKNEETVLKINTENQEKQEVKIIKNESNGNVKKIIKPVMIQSFKEGN